jgi:hypothetical protein
MSVRAPLAGFFAVVALLVAALAGDPPPVPPGSAREQAPVGERLVDGNSFEGSERY